MIGCSAVIEGSNCFSWEITVIDISDLFSFAS